MPGLSEFEGRGVGYWASALEAKMCADADVVVVGGGNSAGQAAVFLAQHASKVFMLIRGESLAVSMSRYLIDRIDATPNIELPTSHRTDTPSRRTVGRSRLGVLARQSNRGRRGAADPARVSFRGCGARRRAGWKAAGLRSTRMALC